MQVCESMKGKKKAKSGIAVSAALNIVRQAAMIAFPFITYSYATRTLGAKGIGVYEFAQSIVGYFSLIAALGVANYAVRDGAKYREGANYGDGAKFRDGAKCGDGAKYKDGADKKINASFVAETQNKAEKRPIDDFASQIFSINLIMTVVSYVLMFVLLYTNRHMYDYRIAIMISSISIFFTTLGADWINSLYEDYLYLTIRYIAVSIAALIGLFVFVKGPEDLYIYIFIAIFSTIVNGILNFFYVRKYVKIRFTLELNLKKHALPIFILFCNQIALVIYLNSDITILGFLTDDTSVGLYGVAAKIYTMIKTLLNAAIFVVIPRFSEYVLKKDERYTEGLKKLLSPLVTFLLPACVGLFFMAEDAVSIVGGDGYNEAALPLRILAIALFFAVMACYFANAIVMPFMLEKYFLLSTVCAAALNIILNFLLIPNLGIAAAAITTLIAEVLVFVMLVVVSAKKVELSQLVNKRDLFGCVAGSVIIGVILAGYGMIFNGRLPQGIIGTIIRILVSVIVYGIILYVSGNSNIKNKKDIP